MKLLENKIDFAVVLTVKNANPNGDPLNGNRPRQDYDGYGEISDVAIKRKIRNRLLDMGENIFVQSDNKNVDGIQSLKERAEQNEALQKIAKEKNPSKDDYAKKASESWIDVRSFGQVFAFKAAKKGEGVSVGVRGPVSIHLAKSLSPIEITSMQITKSVNGEPGEKKGSDTMGMKHFVNYGVYVFYGSINTQLAEKTGFTEDDAEKIKQALITLFENDASSARPEGSMEVNKVYWWKHNSKMGQYSSAKVHQLLDRSKLEEAINSQSLDEYEPNVLEGLEVEIKDGM